MTVSQTNTIAALTANSPPRRLYHHTCVEYLNSIMVEGLNRGDVPTSNWFLSGKNAVWLTTDPSPLDHGLSDARLLTNKERLQHQHAFGALPPKGSRYANKRAVRIEVAISMVDSSLAQWCPWSRRHCSPEVRKGLIDSGGGIRKARTWFLYFGVIRPSKFAEVLVHGRPFSGLVQSMREVA